MTGLVLDRLTNYHTNYHVIILKLLIHNYYTAQKWSFAIRICLVNMKKSVQFSVDLFTFTKEILSGKPSFLCSDGISLQQRDWDINSTQLYTLISRYYIKNLRTLLI